MSILPFSMRTIHNYLNNHWGAVNAIESPP